MEAQLLERAAEVFAAERGSAGESVNVKELHARIGQLALETDFLAGALGRLIWSCRSSAARASGLSVSAAASGVIDRPNQVWATDITYVPMARGFVYLVAVLDWYSRKFLAWRVSNTLTADFCIEAVEEAIARHGAPEIFNSNQGSQFTAAGFIELLNRHRISMDGRGAWRDNVIVERLWKSIKYEEVYLHAYEAVSEAKAGIGRYVSFYNRRRPQRLLDRQTPDTVYYKSLPLAAAA